MKALTALSMVVLLSAVAAAQPRAKQHRRPAAGWTRVWFRLPAAQLGALQQQVNARLIKQGQSYLKRYPGGAFRRWQRGSSSIDTGGSTAAYSFGLYNPQLRAFKRGGNLLLRVDMSNALRGQSYRQQAFEGMLERAVQQVGGSRLLRLQGR